MSKMSELDMDLQTIISIMGEPSSQEDMAQDQVARAVRDAYVATAELYKLRLNPLTASLLAKEEGELWSIHGRVKTVLDEIRADNA
jgi:hypothetical protein